MMVRTPLPMCACGAQGHTQSAQKEGGISGANMAVPIPRAKVPTATNAPKGKQALQRATGHSMQQKYANQINRYICPEGRESPPATVSIN